MSDALHEPDGEDRAVTASTRAQERVARTVGDFGRMLAGAFRRHDPQDEDRRPIVRAARLAATHIGLKPADLDPVDGEDEEAYLERFAAGSAAYIRRVSLEDLDTLEGEGPIVSRDTAGRPLVLLPGKLRGFQILDPVTMAPAAGDVADHGYALHAVLPAGKLSYRSLLAFGVKACTPALVAVLACGIVESLLGLVPPVAFGFVANTVIPTDNVSLLWVVSATLLVALVVQSGVHLTGRFARTQVDGRSGLALHAAMIDRVLRLPSSTFRQSSMAILATQAETVDKFRRSVIDYSVSLVLAVIQGAMAAGLLCFYAPVAGLVAIALVVLLLAIAILVGRLQFQAIYEGERMDVVVLTFVYDLIRLVPVLQAQRGERQAFVQWAQNFLAFQSRIVRSTRMGNVLAAIEAGWEVLTLALCFVAVAYVGVGAGFATGAAIAFVVALGRLNAAGLGSAHAISGIAKLMPMAKLARSLIEQPVMPQSTGAPAGALSGRMTLKKVSFAYDTRTVLEGLNLDVEPGEFIGITGSSGCGKSTLLRLLLGLDQPRSGGIAYDGIDLRALDQGSVTRQIGVVLQNGQLWAGTVFENIRGASALSLEEAEILCGQIGLADEIAALPMGLQTIIGEGGVGLSGGEIQRVLIARALAANPRILILDEPAGGLRGDAQQRLLAFLEELDITRIVISHDPSLLAGADRRFRLESGKLTETTLDAGT